MLSISIQFMKKKSLKNTTPSVQPKRSRIGMILTILVVSAIIAGIIRFYPEKKATGDSPKIDPSPKSQPKPSDSDRKFTNSLGMKFVKIPAGTFTMGSPKDESGRDDDETQHEVTISKPFFMQTTEVTQGQWKAVMGNNPSNFKDCGDNCPVEQVSWNNIQDFIKKLNQKGEGTYRLPTEAEWEYAARAGTTTSFAFGKCLSTDQANYDGNNPLSGCPKGQYRQKTVPVGSFDPNAWGLYDMHGNVWEWCADWKGDYPSSAVTDPIGAENGSYRVLRGGGWYYFARDCRSAYRGGDGPGFGGSVVGFRLACFP
ncbi:MAG: formylglycine-generating enzyme family protein [Desulfobacteraceae bacterium]|nr:formylglycine-generating enzyme family protein [Desulfobacteraceae bacterium]